LFYIGTGYTKRISIQISWRWCSYHGWNRWR